MLDGNGLNPAEYIAAWNKKVESGEAEKEEAAEEQPRRDPVMRDSNGMTAAELRFLRNKQIEEAKAETGTGRSTEKAEPYRDLVMRDSNGLTPAEYIREHNRRIKEAAETEGEGDTAKTSEDGGGEVDPPRRTVVIDAQGRTGAAEMAAEKAELEPASEGDSNKVDDLPDAIRAARDQPKEYAGRRAAELQSQVPENSRGWITMGVGVGTDSDGATRVVVGTSEARGYLREGVTLLPGEERSREPGHAEVSILAYMSDRDIEPSHVAAGRPICSPCADSIDAAGADPASTLKQPREDIR